MEMGRQISECCEGLLGVLGQERRKREVVMNAWDSRCEYRWRRCVMVVVVVIVIVVAAAVVVVVVVVWDNGSMTRHLFATCRSTL